MTSELEQQFFDTFGIELDITSYYHRCNRDLNCKECDEATKIYPPITDRILLELICKLSGVCWPHFSFEISVSELKETILKFCIHYKIMLKHQIRTLFKENN